jgi:hypothetical protein
VISKKFLFFVGLLFVLGMTLGVSQKFHSWSAFQANILTPTLTCSRLADTHMMECNDRGQAEVKCPGLEYVPGTSYVFQLPKTMLHMTCNGTEPIELYWTKDISLGGNKVTIQTSANQIATQIIDVSSLPADCSKTATPYICVDQTMKSSIAAFWVKDLKRHYIVNRNGEFFEYVFDTAKNQWLFSSVKNNSFPTNANNVQTFNLQIPVSVLNTLYQAQ